jgi:hypothetical protein
MEDREKLYEISDKRRRCGLTESVFTESGFTKPFFRFHREKRKADKN